MTGCGSSSLAKVRASCRRDASVRLGHSEQRLKSAELVPAIGTREIEVDIARH
jgi:hypothetical protein